MRILFSLVALLIVVWVAVKFEMAPLSSGTDATPTDTSIIDHAREVVGKATEQYNQSAGLSTDLHGKNLTTVPREVFSQTDATTLNLSENALAGALPAEVRLLSHLTTLNLSHNHFTGVPAEVGQLSELRVLDLSHNPITGLPLELGNLHKLEKLDLSGTNYSKQDLETIVKTLPPNVLIVKD